MRAALTRIAAIAIAGTVALGWFGFAASAATTPVSKASAWLAGQQMADGGFELAFFPGFETPDAVFAIGAAAQTSRWSVCAARAAVLAVHTAAGKTGLDALDDLADTQGDDPGVAAKLIVLTTLPLGLDAHDFDPSGDSPAPVDLVASVLAAARPDGQFKVGALNATAYAIIALNRAQGVVYAPSIAYLQSVQIADGSWNYAGSVAPGDGDVDTTAVALEALLATGYTVSDAAVAKGLAYLAQNQNADGSWSAFGSPDPNSTATASLAVRSAGFDPAVATWRDQVVPALAGQPYADPATFLVAQQGADGRIASPNDGYGINTFATSQAMQALTGARVPVAVTAGPASCADPVTSTTTPAPVGIGGADDAAADPGRVQVQGAVVSDRAVAAGTSSAPTDSDTVPTTATTATTATSTSPTTTSVRPRSISGSSGTQSGGSTGAFLIVGGIFAVLAAGIVYLLRRRAGVAG
jgi:hypothetical protein